MELPADLKIAFIKEDSGMGSMSVGRSGMTEIKLTDGKGNHVGTVRVSKPKIRCFVNFISHWCLGEFFSQALRSRSSTIKR